jgi:hypothetical protein
MHGYFDCVYDNILDLVLSTNPDIIYDLEIHPGMSDHNAITYQVNLSVKRQKKPDRYVYQYKKENIENIKKDMEDLSILSFLVGVLIKCVRKFALTKSSMVLFSCIE